MEDLQLKLDKLFYESNLRGPNPEDWHNFRAKLIELMTK